MKPLDPCLVDSSVWIAGQANPAWLSTLFAGLPDVATCLAAVGEYAVGIYAAPRQTLRDQAREFLSDLGAVAWHGHLPDDFALAPKLIGGVILRARGKPSFADGLIAACALRLNRRVWTTDKHFKEMGCEVYDPVQDKT
jgi:predicted nucleic acid-binding protein